VIGIASVREYSLKEDLGCALRDAGCEVSRRVVIKGKIKYPYGLSALFIKVQSIARNF
jgi:hypothetical protein